mmetsp:Transcript_46102/g.128181  ORF Transcript_46102/g.128181 Transcript_46102/m.128181 type:complete len:274 (-) Transcript_46102:37-858(-)
MFPRGHHALAMVTTRSTLPGVRAPLLFAAMTQMLGCLDDPDNTESPGVLLLQVHIQQPIPKGAAAFSSDPFESARSAASEKIGEASEKVGNSTVGGKVDEAKEKAKVIKGEASNVADRTMAEARRQIRDAPSAAASVASATTERIDDLAQALEGRGNNALSRVFQDAGQRAAHAVSHTTKAFEHALGNSMARERIQHVVLGAASDIQTMTMEWRRNATEMVGSFPNLTGEEKADVVTKVAVTIGQEVITKDYADAIARKLVKQAYARWTKPRD